MLNAEEIIELEKKWLKHKIKQKSKVSIFFILLVILVLAFISQYYFPKQKNITQNKIQKEKVIIKKVEAKKYTQTKPSIKNKESSKEPNPISNSSVVKQETNNTTINKPMQKTVITQKIENKPIKPYYFKLLPTEQGNELFSSNSFLSFNSPIKEIKQAVTEKKQTIQSIRETEKTVEIKKKPAIKIDMKEVNTITYLKQKFYATSSIVFALMLSEEYYNEKKYQDSLKWALTANDIDSQNTKTWYWFAKSKVKLNKQEDAIRALKAYLSNNESKRLRTLLKKIELGDTDD